MPLDATHSVSNRNSASGGVSVNACGRMRLEFHRNLNRFFERHQLRRTQMPGREGEFQIVKDPAKQGKPLR